MDRRRFFNVATIAAIVAPSVVQNLPAPFAKPTLNGVFAIDMANGKTAWVPFREMKALQELHRQQNTEMRGFSVPPQLKGQ